MTAKKRAITNYIHRPVKPWDGSIAMEALCGLYVPSNRLHVDRDLRVFIYESKEGWMHIFGEADDLHLGACPKCIARARALVVIAEAMRS